MVMVMARLFVYFTALCALSQQSEARHIVVLNDCTANPSETNCLAYKIAGEMQAPTHTITSANITTAGCTDWLSTHGEDPEMVVVFGEQWSECLEDNFAKYPTKWFLIFNSCVHGSNIFCAQIPPAPEHISPMLYPEKLILHWANALPSL